MASSACIAPHPWRVRGPPPPRAPPPRAPLRCSVVLLLPRSFEVGPLECLIRRRALVEQVDVVGKKATERQAENRAEAADGKRELVLDEEVVDALECAEALSTVELIEVVGLVKAMHLSGWGGVRNVDQQRV